MEAAELRSLVSILCMHIGVPDSKRWTPCATPLDSVSAVGSAAYAEIECRVPLLTECRDAVIIPSLP